jgi:hypothetical protein
LGSDPELAVSLPSIDHHGQTTADDDWRMRLSRVQSGIAKRGSFRDFRRLRQLRATDERRACQTTHANYWVLSNENPCAFSAMASRRRRRTAVHALVERHSRSPVALPTPDDWDGSSVPEPIHVRAHYRRRTPALGLAIHREKCTGGRLGEARGGLAVVQCVASRVCMPDLPRRRGTHSSSFELVGYRQRLSR